MTFNLGIDLGTSHSSLAYSTADGVVRMLEIPQLASASSTVSDPLLPSVYFANQEFKNLSLPWSDDPPILGRWARDLSLVNPERAIVSAKSWLCHRGNVRLPLNASWTGLTAKGVSTLLLAHLIEAFSFATGDGKGPIGSIALAVPASFDPVARQMTEEAAQDAGLPHVFLIEEPLAAFYAWLAKHADWNRQLKPGDSVLVCDVGGGTCDFSLIAAAEDSHGELRLDRIAVGRHLLLGGDNMDLAIAHSLAQKHGSLDPWQFIALQQEVRRAKEILLSPMEALTYPISVASRGSSIFAETQRLDLDREDVERILVEGFFPEVGIDASVRRNTGLQASGLPYEHDPRITSHLAAFLRQANAASGGEGVAFQPTHVLFNGGVFKARVLQDRVTACLSAWNGSAIKVLDGEDLDHAVTLGAAFYAQAKSSGSRLRVRTAAPRSYYIGLEANQMAIPGMKPRIEGLCVLPQGTEEGSAFQLDSQEIGLWGGSSVTFQLYSSPDRTALGERIADAEADLESVTSLSCLVEERGDGPIPVFLETDYDETGKLSVGIRERDGERRWDLAFQLREELSAYE